MKRINILLPPDLATDFAARCDECGVPMATVVRAIIEREMAAPTLTGTKRQKVDSEQERIISALRRKEAEERKRDIIRAVTNDGARLREVAERYGMTVSGVSRVLKRAGASIPGSA